MIYLCADINKKGAPYCAVWSLLIAQCAYELVLSGAAVYPVWTPAEHGSPWAVLVQLLSGAVFFLRRCTSAGAAAFP